MFCVECGTETGGEKLCPACSMRKREPMRLPERLALQSCPRCGSFVLGAKWKAVPLEEAAAHLVESSLRPQGLSCIVSLAAEDDSNWRAKVSVERKVEGESCTDELATRVSLSPRVCDRCSRHAGSYYEAIIQVRADGRSPSADELEDAVSLVEKRAGALSAKGVFVSKVEDVRGGADIYLSSRDLARQVAKELAERFAGETTASPKLFGQKDGKDIYRVTHLVRLPEYGRGSILQLGGKLYQIRTLGRKSVGVRALGTWDEESLTPREIAKAKVVAGMGDVREAVIVSESAREVQVLDPKSNRTVEIVKPRSWRRRGETARIIQHGEEYFLL